MMPSAQAGIPMVITSLRIGNSHSVDDLIGGKVLYRLQCESHVITILLVDDENCSTL